MWRAFGLRYGRDNARARGRRAPPAILPSIALPIGVLPFSAREPVFADPGGDAGTFLYRTSNTFMCFQHSQDAKPLFLGQF